jgi:hypothetical protein
MAVLPAHPQSQRHNVASCCCGRRRARPLGRQQTKQLARSARRWNFKSINAREVAMPDQPVAEPSDRRDQQTNQTAGLGPVLREQAEKLADRSKDAGLDTAQAVGKAAERAAEELQGHSPELANYLRNAATYTQGLADDLGHRPAAELLSNAVEWGRKQPLVALAGAAILGFALSRIVRTGMSDQGDGR